LWFSLDTPFSSSMKKCELWNTAMQYWPEIFYILVKSLIFLTIYKKMFLFVFFRLAKILNLYRMLLHRNVKRKELIHLLSRIKTKFVIFTTEHGIKYLNILSLLQVSPNENMPWSTEHFFCLHASPLLQKPGTSKTGIRQVKVMKEFVCINRNVFQIWQGGEKN
jgi:hypothetical protein